VSKPQKIKGKFFVIEKLIIPDQNCITFISSFVGFYFPPQFNCGERTQREGGEENKKEQNPSIDLLHNFFLLSFPIFIA
jgi:hypothetical protein